MKSRKRPTRLTNDQKLKVVYEYLDNTPMDKLIIKYDVSPASVYLWHNQYASGALQPSINNNLTKSIKLHIISAIQSGRSIPEVAAAHKLQSGTIHSIIEEFKNGLLDTPTPKQITPISKPDDKITTHQLMGNLLTEMLSNNISFDVATKILSKVA